MPKYYVKPQSSTFSTRNKQRRKQGLETVKDVYKWKLSMLYTVTQYTKNNLSSIPLHLSSAILTSANIFLFFYMLLSYA